jgi:polyisoprenoid-binding protein YceI
VSNDVDLYFNYLGKQVEDEGEQGKFDVAGFEGRTVISRTEFKIGESGGGAGENVKITIAVEAQKKVN